MKIFDSVLQVRSESFIHVPSLDASPSALDTVAAS